MKFKKKPQRSCVGCGIKIDKNSLIRIIKNSNENIFIDETGKKPGRGFYICYNKRCLETIIKKNFFKNILKIKEDSTIINNLFFFIKDRKDIK